MEKELVKQFIISSLAEDVGDGDHTSLSSIPQGTQGKARLLIKENGILAGVDLAKDIFATVDPELKLEIFIIDGTLVKVGDVALTVFGSVHSILKAERLVLNTMQRMSGIATVTNLVVKQLEGTSTKVLDTRKTTPGIRFLEKWAVLIGGGVNHRFGLYDMILIKDNHVDYAGGIKNAIVNAHNYLKQTGKNLQIEIETRNLDEVKQVIDVGGIDRIMLDNFSFENLRQAVKLINGQFVTEASGGITLENAHDYALCGVNYISMGALTHSVKSLDMSLKAM
ncbi:nicotinate-nucleotide diphosphorylase (carboxylating) [Solitalea longa]|uniref:Probable nicotinate-nucleotide pyrophosphorylase [carboxylating] n=1 Tax=Solitalea longa TaxID=2079460 RepID=A0A2S4ZY38_9SPHI|nr:carboxylating nicotinate-nucleotide diphosphorylase [Solitalea longa]POY35264.1 nicotinate-nucleotide diphosphorylase (carboxylating) [Solitalea longa]